MYTCVDVGMDERNRRRGSLSERKQHENEGTWQKYHDGELRHVPGYVRLQICPRNLSGTKFLKDVLVFSSHIETGAKRNVIVSL